MARPFSEPICQETADTLLVQNLERVVFKHAVSDVVIKEFRCVVTTHPEGRLGEVVRPVGEKLRFGGDFISSECCARQFDHRADKIFDAGAGIH